MIQSKSHIKSIIHAPFFRAVLLVLFFVFLIPAYAQNTKGDQPSKPTREARFKTKTKKKKSQTSNKRISPFGKSKATSGARGKTESSRAWKGGDITGRKIPAQRSSKKRRFDNVQPQSGQYVRKLGSPKSDDAPKFNTGTYSQKKVRSTSGRARNVYPRSGGFGRTPSLQSTSGKNKNVFPKRGPYVAKTKPPSKDDSPKYKGRRVATRPGAQSATGKNQNVFPKRGPYVAKTKPPSKGDVPKSWRGSTVSKPKVRSATGKTKNVFPKRGSYSVTTKAPSKDDSPGNWRGNTVNKPKVRSSKGATRNVFPQNGPYVSNPSVKARKNENPPGKKKKTPVTASKPYMRRTSINPYAGFWNRKVKGERAYVGDISGKKLRSKNYQTPQQAPVKATVFPYMQKKRVGDVAYSGKGAGSYKSASKSGQAWKGDISGNKLRDKNQSSKGKLQAGKPFMQPKGSKSLSAKVGRLFGRAAVSSSMSGQVGKPLKQTPPSGSITGQVGKPFRKPPVSKSMNGQVGKPFRKSPMSASMSGQPGKPYRKVPASKSISGQVGKPFGKGARSASGTMWNNNHRALDGKPPKKDAYAMGGFRGNMKASKPFRGGGSVSGKLWNNKGNAIAGREPKGNVYAIGSFQGRMKASKPLKGGASVSGKLWNNKGSAIAGRQPKGDAYAIGTFQGSLKAKKPLKGGGSVSGKLWNNNQQPIQVRQPVSSAMANYQGNKKAVKKEPSKEIGGFPGKYRMFDLHPSMRKQGEDYTGDIRRSKLHNDYVQNDNASKKSLLKARPGKSTYLVDGLQISVIEKKYAKKPNAFDGALPGIAPSKTSVKASEYARAVKKPNYIRNESSDEDALKVKEPGKAFASVSDYQGNIKMKKFDLFAKKDLHPDAQFVKTNKNNVKEERGLVTNFKLLWARLFKQSDTQPSHLKEKIQKPRYDKGEIGMWAK